MSRGPQLLVLSREEVEAYSPESGRKTVCISITDPTTRLASLKGGYADVLRFAFHDLEQDAIGLATDVGKVRLMDVLDAQAIVAFAVQHADADVLVVHCEAGISRSRSVAEALFDAFGRRAPNQYIYRLVLDAFKARRDRLPSGWSVGNEALPGYDGTLWIDYRWSPGRRGPR